MAGFIRKYRRGRQRGDRDERPGHLRGDDTLNYALDNASGAAASSTPSSILGGNFLAEFRPDEIAAGTFTGWTDRDGVYTISPGATAPTATAGQYITCTTSTNGLTISSFVPLGNFTMWIVIEPDTTNRAFLLGSSGADYWCASAYNTAGAPGMRNAVTGWIPAGSHIGTGSKVLLRFGADAASDGKVLAVGGSAEKYDNSLTWNAAVTANQFTRNDAGLRYSGKIYRAIFADTMYRDADSEVAAIVDYCNTQDSLGL